MTSRFDYADSSKDEYSSLTDVIKARFVKEEVKIVEKPKERVFKNYSLYVFRPHNGWRRFSIKVIQSTWFEILIISLIIINSLFLTIFDYEHPHERSWRNLWVLYSEPFFIVAFSVEAILKIIALGFVLDEGTYLRDPWNWLDFFVVLTSLGSLIPGMANVSVIRTFRLFRPLRSLTMMPALKSIISTIFMSMLNLGEIMIFAFLFFYIFAILGVSLWNGDIHYRCYETPQPVDGDWVLVPGDLRVCGSRKCDVGYCGSLIRQYDHHPGTIDLDIVGR